MLLYIHFDAASEGWKGTHAPAEVSGSAHWENRSITYSRDNLNQPIHPERERERERERIKINSEI